MESTTQTNSQTLVDRVKDSVLLKVVLIGILTVLLLIPSILILSLIEERQQRQKEVIHEISEKWASKQLLEGPVLLLPYREIVSSKDSAGTISYKEVINTIHILPEELNIKGKAGTETLHRGIYDATVYDAQLQVQGSFSKLDIKKPGIDPQRILWNDAKVVIGLSDLKGLKTSPRIQLSGQSYEVEPDFSSLNLFSNNLVILPKLGEVQRSDLNFSFKLDLKGAEELRFLPLGKTTRVNLSADWAHPSFTGRQLPEERNLDSAGFSASWSLPHFNRPFPQQWTGGNTRLMSEEKDISFGVEFLQPVDQYQKNTRSAKYAILIIVLAFTALFFSEFLINKRVHLFQYLLIGAAMVIYYILLLSLSEQLSFNIAYLIASGATVALIGSFIGAILKDRKPAIILAAILSVFYLFVFVLIQLQDLALLFGAIGLFAIIATLMYFSAKMDWNRGFR